MPYRTVLFDVGETLIRVPRPAPVYQQILARHGAVVDLPVLEDILGEARKLQDEHFPDWLSDDLRLDRASAEGRRNLHVETIIGRIQLNDPESIRRALFDLYVSTELFTLYPDVEHTLQILKLQGFRLGIVSNWEPRLRLLCAAHGIDDYFDFAVISEVEGYSKPHPRLYERALELAEATPEDVVHVGDKLREDVEGATAVGISAVLIDRLGTAAGLHEPRIRSLDELPAILAL